MTHGAIVTGVSRGLGEALAATLLSQGFHVIGVGRSSSDLLAGSAYRFVGCDLAHTDAIAAAVEPALRDLATLKLESVTLINNAAVAFPVGVIGKVDIAEVQRALATNIAAPVVMCDVFMRVFADDAVRRRIINISSGAAQSAIAGIAVYCMSKAAIEMLTRTLAAEHSSPALRCISLRPGIFETDMQRQMRSQDPAEFPSSAMFRAFKQNDLLASPAHVAARIVERLVRSDVEHGRTYTHEDL
jgi:benzil reductase ((S)-benzoin forming)